jgi:hypothetical protein
LGFQSLGRAVHPVAAGPSHELDKFLCARPSGKQLRGAVAVAIEMLCLGPLTPLEIAGHQILRLAQPLERFVDAENVGQSICRGGWRGRCLCFALPRFIETENVCQPVRRHGRLLWGRWLRAAETECGLEARKQALHRLSPP